jgi:hypothetical protein
MALTLEAVLIIFNTLFLLKDNCSICWLAILSSNYLNQKQARHV